MKFDQVKSKLGSIAESVRATILYDLEFKISPLDFFRAKVLNDCHEEKILSQSIYKYRKDG